MKNIQIMPRTMFPVVSAFDVICIEHNTCSVTVKEVLTW